jgi:hypothetical protein
MPEQVEVDKRGYEAQDTYDKAAAEEWVCRTLKTPGAPMIRRRLLRSSRSFSRKMSIGLPGVYDDRRFDRYRSRDASARSCLAGRFCPAPFRRALGEPLQTAFGA